MVQTNVKFNQIDRHNLTDRYCPICDSQLKQFEPAGKSQRPNARCSICSSLERHRLAWLFLLRQTNLFRDRVKLLHFAPESYLRDRFLQFPNIDYLTADISFDRNPMVKVDIQDMVFGHDVFDIILCSHVLEHVPNDRKAMKELYRVLKPNGQAVLMVPMQFKSEQTLEDPTVKTRQQRLKLYGQADHVRHYGVDIKERLEEAGFKVNLEKCDAAYNAAERAKYGLQAKHYIYQCIKPSSE